MALQRWKADWWAGSAAALALAFGLALAGLAVALAPQPVEAHEGGLNGLVAQEVLGARGPYTIKGVVLDPHGRPLANYPLRILPVLPQKGVDRDNTYYEVPGRDEHRVVTDAEGRFVMTGVVDYPQVKHHTYRLQGNWTHDFTLVDAYGSDVLSFVNVPKNTIELTIRTEPGATLRVVVKDRSGRPFTGTRAVSVATGHGRRLVITVDFENGVGRLLLPPGDVQTPGRVALLRWGDQREARRQAESHGHPTDFSAFVSYGMQGQRSVALLPGQTTTVEFTLGE
jgi:hypothetical protein